MTIVTKPVAACGLALGLILASALVAGDRAALAEWRSPYAWCAFLSDIEGGGQTDCSFHNFQQCRDTIQGVGGRCYENPHYFGPIEQPRARRQRPAR
jgi:hypothetical protein